MYEQNTEEQIIQANNLGSFFRFINKRTKRSGITCINDEAGEILYEDHDKAEAFNKYFASIWRSDNGITPDWESLNVNSLESVCLTEPICYHKT